MSFHCSFWNFEACRASFVNNEHGARVILTFHGGLQLLDFQAFKSCWLRPRLRLPLMLCLWIRIRLSIFFTAGFGLGFDFPEFCVWLPRFNRRFDEPSFTNFVSISIYLQATLFASIRPLRNLCLSCVGKKTFSMARKVFPSERNRGCAE